jgi:hypothetical protein
MPSPEFRRAVSAICAVSALVFWAVILTLGVIYNFNDNQADFLTSDGLRYVMPGLTALIGGVVAGVFAVPVPTIQRLGNLLTAEGPRRSATSTKTAFAIANVVTYVIGGAVALASWIATGGDTVDFVRTIAAAWGGIWISIVTGYFK